MTGSTASLLVVSSSSSGIGTLPSARPRSDEVVTRFGRSASSIIDRICCAGAGAVVPLTFAGCVGARTGIRMSSIMDLFELGGIMIVGGFGPDALVCDIMVGLDMLRSRYVTD